MKIITQADGSESLEMNEAEARALYAELGRKFQTVRRRKRRNRKRKPL